MAHDTALVIIDVQAGMLDEAIPEERATLATIAGVLERARTAGVPVIYVQHDGGPGHPLEVDTPGWRVHPAIAPREGEPVIRKRASDSFYKTPLKEEMEARGVRRLVVTGAMTEYCVDTTCRRALSEGYDVTLVADGHATFDRDDMPAERIKAYHNSRLAQLAHPDHAVTVLPAAEVAF